MLVTSYNSLQVNASGQFCGVAEMVGPVDFEKDADYWQQDRWSGQFPVQWHIVKDVPNIRFRHILLENNDNKPITHSRDCQEVAYLSQSLLFSLKKKRFHFYLETRTFLQFRFGFCCHCDPRESPLCKCSWFLR